MMSASVPYIPLRSHCTSHPSHYLLIYSYGLGGLVTSRAAQNGARTLAPNLTRSPCPARRRRRNRRRCRRAAEHSRLTPPPARAERRAPGPPTRLLQTRGLRYQYGKPGQQPRAQRPRAGARAAGLTQGPCRAPPAGCPRRGRAGLQTAGMAFKAPPWRTAATGPRAATAARGPRDGPPPAARARLVCFRARRPRRNRPQGAPPALAQTRPAAPARARAPAHERARARAPPRAAQRGISCQPQPIGGLSPSVPQRRASETLRLWITAVPPALQHSL